jgi:NAD(P)H-nitrite reductase large subunit
LELDDTICYCFHVSKRKILNFLRVHRPVRASQLSQCGGAGSGCGWCIPYLKSCFEKGAAAAAASDQTVAADYARGRALYLREGRGTPPPGAEPPPDLEASAK